MPEVLRAFNAFGKRLANRLPRGSSKQLKAVQNVAMKEPKGSPLDRVPQHLSILSYNLLAPLYVRPIDRRTGNVQSFAAFKWAEPAEQRLDWEVRWPRLQHELSESRADVICLQEVQYEREAGSEDFALPQWLLLEGYLPCIPPQDALANIAARNERVLGTEAAIGNAVLIRRERLEVVKESERNGTTLVAMCIRGRPGTPLAPLQPTAIASLHLDAKSEEQRVKQLGRSLEQARAMGTRELLIAGDMNTECLKGSCVAAYLCDVEAPSKDELAEECSKALRLSSLEPSEDGSEDGQVEEGGATSGAGEEVDAK
eukprot:gene24530-29837_t